MLYIYLFGHLRVFQGKKPIEVNARPKSIILWALLLLRRKSSFPRDSLAFSLWPDDPDDSARADLRRHLHDLDRALPRPPDEQLWLLRQGDTVQWNPESAFWLDVAEFERLSALPDYLEKAAALYTDDLLLNLYDDILDDERNRLRAKYFDVVRHLVVQQQSIGKLDLARSYAEEALRREPLDEPLVRNLMQILYQTGDRTRALQTFETFRKQLIDEIFIEPAQETSALYEMIVAEKPPRDSVPSVGEAKQGKHNLPAAMTAIFGREEELASLFEMLTHPLSLARLITLVGPPGTGKTRMALEAGRRLLIRQSSTFPDGVYFVDLSAVTDTSLVIPAIAAILQVKEKPTQLLMECLKDHLKSLYILLILDNFEQLLGAATEVADLLGAAPGLRLLVTSRELLKLYGEHEFAVKPLPYPKTDELPDVSAMLDYPAVQLFDARARQSQRHFMLTNGNALAVTEICAQLDGLPLAVELAAGQVSHLSLSDIASQLETKRTTLASDLRNLPPRHETLQRAIEWSYLLLSEEEKHLFTQLSVFAGGWTLAAAEAICDSLPSRQIADVLTSLSEKNLIHSLFQEHEQRYRMLATIREFAQERLRESPASAEIHRRFASFFTKLVEQIHQNWYGSPDKRELMQLLGVEEDNFQAILSWALIESPLSKYDEISNPVLIGARLTVALHNYWRMRGTFNEAIKWHHLALKFQADLPLEQQMQLLNTLGVFFQTKGDLAAAQVQYQASLKLGEQLGDDWYVSKVLNNLGIIAAIQARYQDAKQLFIDTIKTARRTDPHVMSDHINGAISNLALVYKYLGEYEAAESLLEEALVYDRSQGDQEKIAARLHNLGSLFVVKGEPDRAVAYYQEALSLDHAIQYVPGTGNSLYGLAGAYFAQAQYERSCRLFGFANALRSQVGFSLGEQVAEEVERQLAVLRDRLGPEIAADLLFEGASMTLDQAVMLALSS